MSHILNSVSGRYAIALAAMLLALLGAGASAPFTGGYVAYIVLAPALAFTALYCGLGPSVLATTIALFGVRYWFVSPSHSLRFPDTSQSIAFVAFFLASCLIVALGERSRRNQKGLRETQKDLEAQVEERTAELDTANRGLGDLTARLLHLQDEERRRIARELHDSVGQSLAALSMNLSSLGRDIERIAKSASTVADSAALVNEMSTDIRTISYLLHPPLLDEAGLASALRWYIQGFTERSGIKVDLKLAEDFDRLPRDLETAIFRLVQECLTNIHRHSESPIATITITRFESEVQVEVVDQGTGIPPEKKSGLLSEGTPGVGIRGMRERLRQLGGTLEIDSNGNGKGTIVVARLPVPIGRANVVAMAGGTSTY
jgi:signal transduction histidine kinase